MAFILADRVRETSSAPGTGTVTLLGAVTGYQTFSAGIGANNTTYYVIADQSGTNWEVGLGTIGAGGTTLARTTVLSSSNSGSLVNFSSGTQDIFCDYPAGKQVSSDYPNAIGVVTPSTGSFTTLNSTGGALNGTIGATTASTGRFSDLTDTGLTSGRVTYATTGGNLTDSANLTFSGTTLVANDITDSSLTATRVVYAGTGGNLVNASNFTYDGTNLVAGAIQNTPIGGTTPAAGTFTTITGQTGVLKGTGMNTFVQSQTFNTSWANSALTINQTATTAPNGTSTGNSLIPTVANTIHRINSPSITNISGVTYTVSVYAKANGYNYLYINCVAAFNAGTTFNLSTGAISATAVGTATITDAGSGWYRCTVTGTASSTQTNTPFFQVNNTVTTAADDTYAGNGTSGIFLWGAQYEIGSTANTYIPTTTTAVYGTPTLSFSGVAGLGLQSDGSLYVSPAGTGAIQAQATTSSTAGGNARGANAVDWQTARNNANQVASGQYSVVGGGSANRSSVYGSFIGGGEFNLASGFDAAVLGGASQQASGGYATAGAGLNNIASGSYAGVFSGYFNTASGYVNFIGGGERNSGTANSAVTTQSATMNATTAVTLSGSNANIKVGQLITGTSIVTYPNQTYVAAVSGTSLTLSQAASGSSTSTLSFFTPHGVVVGGGNNQATGSYSFIGGGGDAGTAANRNVASGDWSFVGGGWKNTASGLFGGALSGTNNTASGVASVVCGGGSFGSITQISGNTASGLASFVGAGFDNISSSNAAFIGGGKGNRSSGLYSAVIAGSDGTTRGIWGNHVIPALNPLSGTGTSQSATLVLGRQTTDATATVLTCDSSAASGTNQVILPNNSAYFFTGEVVSGVTGGGNTKGWTIEGVIKRGANAASTALVGTPTVTSLYADAGAATWTIAVTANTTLGCLTVTFTGQAATTIRTVCQIRTTEMTY